MSASGAEAPADATRLLTALPEFRLDCAFDDPVAPTEVTVSEPDVADATTHWITVDVGLAVDLADVA